MYIYVYICHIFSIIHLPIDIKTIHKLAVLNTALMNMHVLCFFVACSFVSSGMVQLEHVLVLLLVFLGTSLLISIVTVLVYNFISSAQEFPFYTYLL